MGRKNKFIESHKKSILDATTLGCTKRLACKYAGISETVLYDWLSRGRGAENEEFITFLEDFNKAEAMSALRSLGTLNQAMKAGDIRAAMFLLERRHGYNKVDQPLIEIKVSDDSLNVRELMEEIDREQIKLKPIALPTININE
tara:strand:+ start:104 stop:535 length:432 start_codon:yes stop_codon:yes gene_type:complete